MRLLKKSEIDSAKAQDRKREIDEGVKIAHRVDSLRETQAQEEASLEKFRKETVASINEEIISKTKEKNELIKEVSDLEDKKVKALEPLDALWKEVNEKKDELTRYAISLNEEKVILNEQKKEHAIEVDRLKVEENRVTDERDRSIKSLTKAEENREKSQATLIEAQEIKDSAVKLKESVLSELKERDKVLASKERDMENREMKLKKAEDKLNKDKRLLLDRQQMFERTLKRKI